MKSMYVMNNSENLFSGELTECLIEAGFIQYQFQMSICYKYAPDEQRLLSRLMLITVSIAVILMLLDT